MYTIWEIKPKIYGLCRCLPKEKREVERFLLFLAHTVFLWNNLWSVSRYIMGSFSGCWRLCGNDQQCLAAPIWKYRSGFGDHRFTFFIDFLPNYTFYTNLTNIVHWVVTYRDVAHLITLNWGNVEKKYAKSFDAGLRSLNNLELLLYDQSVDCIYWYLLNTFRTIKTTTKVQKTRLRSLLL